MDKVWLKNYMLGTAHEIPPSDKTLIDLFDDACQRFNEKKAITCHDCSITFASFKKHVLILAQEMIALGIKKGDRVAVMLPNSLQYPIAVFAIFAAGATVVNVNPLYTADEVLYILQDSRPSLIICLDMLANKLAGCKGKYGINNIITTNIADLYPFFKRNIIKFVQKYIQKTIPSLDYDAISFRTFCTSNKSLNSYVKIDKDQLAFIQYTGATTGRPKGAMLSHSNIVSNIRQIHAVLIPQKVELDEQIVMCVLPLYHIFSLTANLFTFTLSGAENVMIPNPKDFKSLIKTLNKTPFTIFNSLDTLYHKLLESPEFVNTPHTTYKYGICGGMATRISVANEIAKVLGHPPANCYGLSETSPAVSMSYLNEEYNGSVGFPIPSTEISIRALKNLTQEVEIGIEGVILVRGPQVMSGYWNNPEQTKKALSSDGWLNTGDVGYFTPEGRLFITSRVTEMIIVSGFNVYPAEIERVIDDLDYVKEVAVVGRPDENTGEAAHVYIVLKDDALATPEEIIKHCKKYLTKYKIPRTVHFLSELPKTAVGKIDKKNIVHN